MYSDLAWIESITTSPEEYVEGIGGIVIGLVYGTGKQ